MFDDFVNSVVVTCPHEGELAKFQEICSMYYEKIQKNLVENQKLASLYDFIVPMLMNGQIGFKEA